MDWNFAITLILPFFSFLYNVFKISIDTKINISIKFNAKKTKKKATKNK